MDSFSSVSANILLFFISSLQGDAIVLWNYENANQTENFSKRELVIAVWTDENGNFGKQL